MSRKSISHFFSNIVTVIVVFIGMAQVHQEGPAMRVGNLAIKLRSVSPAMAHMVTGFTIDTPAKVASAAKLGVNTAILYGDPPTPSSVLGQAMMAVHMKVIDAGIATYLYYYECHRTLTVAPPPRGTYTICRHDYTPHLFTGQTLLSAIDKKLLSDSQNPLVIGYWVMDDWPIWDGGSARQILQAIHAHAQRITPSDATICGIGANIVPADYRRWTIWYPSRLLNYSNAACDILALYAYAGGALVPSTGSNFDYTMVNELPILKQGLAQQGWSLAKVPLLGIAQAYSGPYATYYMPGLNQAQMLQEATAFCRAGATSIGWYSWNDTGFKPATRTPSNSAEISNGIRNGVAACKHLWG